MGIENGDLLRFQSGPMEGGLHALFLTGTIRKNKIAGVGIHGVARDFPVYLGAAFPGPVKPLKGKKTTALGDDNTVAVAVT